MNAILLIGIPGSGKSTFFKQRFADSHVRVNLDMLRTRHREKRLIETCIEIGQPFVVDNTNVTKLDRKRYLQRLADAKIPVCGYYFQSSIAGCVNRNEARPESGGPPLYGVGSR